jgi:hypothetical protein
MVAGQMSTAPFDVVDAQGDLTGERIAPVARRIDLAGAYQRFGVAIGGSVGVSGESYGDAAEPGPGGTTITAGLLAPFTHGAAGAALTIPGLGTVKGATIPDVLNAGGTITAIGLAWSGAMIIPLAGPAGPTALAGMRWPVAEAVDILAGYGTTFVSGVPLLNGATIRAGLSLRSDWMGLDYTLTVPVVSGPGITHQLALGWDFGSQRLQNTPPAADEPAPAPAPESPER